MVAKHCRFAPEKGQWQISMFLGGGNKFYSETTDYLLPHFTNTGGSVGVGAENAGKNACEAMGEGFTWNAADSTCTYSESSGS